MTTVDTTCPYCGVGCGLSVTVDGGRGVQVLGDKAHPANFGRLCSKGAALGETVGLEGRLLTPRVDGAETDWDTALDAVSGRFRQVVETHGPDAIAMYVSGQLLTEDYYVANKLMKGFIGTANIDTNSRLCMASAVAAYKRAFGSDTVPTSYEDLEQADLVVLTGANLAWCHPVLYQRLLTARKARPEMRIIVIDPRRTATCDGADLHLPLRSGSDGFLFGGLMVWLHEHGITDHSYVAAHTDGLEEALHLARWYAPSVAAVAAQCVLHAQDVEQFYRMFAASERTVTLWSQGINQSVSGTDKGNAIVNCHLLTGRMGRPGMGPFSITGQPNAMGGREVGGLCNQLAAHMELDNDGHRGLVQRFWEAPLMADQEGLKAVDLFRAVGDGRIKALWVIGTNPAVSMPDTDLVRRALERCDCLVVSDCVEGTDTQRHADILLPALTWGEKDGTVTNSERRISRQRPFLAAPGQVKPDWWIICGVARRLGYRGFDFAGPAQIFDEHARLSGFENRGERDFDISALAGMGKSAYDAMRPVQWPVPSGPETPARLFGEGRFFTGNGRAHFIPVTPRPPANHTDQDYPLVLNTGRVRDHWHTMTRSGKSPRLSGHITELFVEIHPQDAVGHGLRDGELAKLVSSLGETIMRVRVTDAQTVGGVFAPMHWNDQTASAARVGGLIRSLVDPVSGQPELKHAPVRVLPYRAKWYGFLLSRRALLPQQASYWSKARRYSLWHYELAGELSPDDWAACTREQLCVSDDSAEWRELYDSTQVNYRAARIVDGRLDAVIIIGPDYRLPPRDWLVELFKRDRIEDAERMRLLRGTPSTGQQDAGAIVCSCFSVGVNTLRQAIGDQGLESPEAIGAALNAGTNCGSCVPELRRLIADVRMTGT